MQQHNVIPFPRKRFAPQPYEDIDEMIDSLTPQQDYPLREILARAQQIRKEREQ